MVTARARARTRVVAVRTRRTRILEPRRAVTRSTSDTFSGKYHRSIFLYLRYGLTVPTRLYSEKHSKKERALERLREGDAWDTVALEFAEHAGTKGK